MKEEWSVEKKKRITEGYALFDTLFKEWESKNLTFAELHTLIDDKLFSSNSYLSGSQILSIANAFRHLNHPYNPKLTTDFGDYAAEYIITTLIASIETNGSGLYYDEETNKLLSDAYYQLSQTYTHLLVFSSKITWVSYSPLKGHITYTTQKGPSMLNFEVTYDAILQKRLNLLRQAIFYNPSNYQAWVRVLEFYLSNDEFTKASRYSQDPSIIQSWHTLNFSQKGDLAHIFLKASEDPDCHFANKNELISEIKKISDEGIREGHAAIEAREHFLMTKQKSKNLK
ncbi:hypothetical protein [Candidatus Paracaedibacter symbiosus]|uniref:hypothetical protein n=1 Tax=Candidatus Paracaedibacter symbiosus TaxID=244582 RepID=UPI0012ECB136|nr:hypothetical protein [Candidatus Paracaedibacter symbiosus]